jgi:hypothetical protein
MQDFLRRGLPDDDEQHWRTVSELLAGPELPAATRAHLAIVGTARQRLALQPLRALRPIASPRVAERDALLRIAHWQRQAPGHEDDLHRAIDAAERLFAACDPQHATLSYLRYLRKNEYTRKTATNELRRSGPQILAHGRLDPANTAANDQLVMRGVTGFALTPNNDCDTATVAITATPVAPNTFTAAQGFGNPVTRTISLRTGSRPYVD